MLNTVRALSEEEALEVVGRIQKEVSCKVVSSKLEHHTRINDKVAVSLQCSCCNEVSALLIPPAQQANVAMYISKIRHTRDCMYNAASAVHMCIDPPKPSSRSSIIETQVSKGSSWIGSRIILYNVKNHEVPTDILWVSNEKDMDVLSSGAFIHKKVLIVRNPGCR